MPKIHLSLGSNIGDREHNIRRALYSIQGVLSLDAVSDTYETKPWGYEEQPNFINICASGKTELQPIDLLLTLKQIEKELGRTGGDRWGPRIIDIDLLFYGQIVLHIPEIDIPHSRIEERAFVLVPLCDIDPDFIHPELGLPVSQLRKKLDCSGVKRIGEPLVTI